MVRMTWTNRPTPSTCRPAGSRIAFRFFHFRAGWAERTLNAVSPPDFARLKMEGAALPIFSVEGKYFTLAVAKGGNLQHALSPWGVGRGIWLDCHHYKPSLCIRSGNFMTWEMPHTHKSTNRKWSKLKPHAKVRYFLFQPVRSCMFMSLPHSSMTSKVLLFTGPLVPSLVFASVSSSSLTSGRCICSSSWPGCRIYMRHSSDFSHICRNSCW